MHVWMCPAAARCGCGCPPSWDGVAAGGPRRWGSVGRGTDGARRGAPLHGLAAGLLLRAGGPLVRAGQRGRPARDVCLVQALQAEADGGGGATRRRSSSRRPCTSSRCSPSCARGDGAAGPVGLAGVALVARPGAGVRGGDGSVRAAVAAAGRPGEPHGRGGLEHVRDLGEKFLGTSPWVLALVWSRLTLVGTYRGPPAAAPRGGRRSPPSPCRCCWPGRALLGGLPRAAAVPGPLRPDLRRGLPLLAARGVEELAPRRAGPAGGGVGWVVAGSLVLAVSAAQLPALRHERTVDSRSQDFAGAAAVLGAGPGPVTAWSSCR